MLTVSSYCPDHFKHGEDFEIHGIQASEGKSALNLKSKLIRRSIEEIVLNNNKDAAQTILPNIYTLYEAQHLHGLEAKRYFFNLAAHGHEEILSSAFEINTHHDSYVEAFFKAAEEGNSLVIKTLLNAGMQEDINARKSKDGQTALYLASLEDKTEVVKLLLSAGANIETKFNGKTSLNIAKGETRKLLTKYAHNPVDYLLEVHTNDPMAFMKATKNLVKSGYDFTSHDSPDRAWDLDLVKSGYDFTSHDSPDRAWDLDSEKISEYLNKEVAGGNTTNFRKIIKSADEKSIELALSFKPNLSKADQVLLDRFYKDNKNKNSELRL